MNATAVRTENDGRQWFAVTFDDGETETYGLDTVGTMLDADGCPVADMNNSRNIAARSAIESGIH